MRRFIAITAAVIVGFAALASAQSATTKPLADVAKDEEARRKSVRKPAKVYTNNNLRSDISTGVAAAPTPPASTDKPANASPLNTSPTAPGSNAPTAGARDQAYWSGRIQAARTAMARTQMFAESLQSRINALTTEFVNRDDPAQRAKLEGDRKAALAELERVRQELEDQRIAIAAIEEEARRANVPSGWLRPGA